MLSDFSLDLEPEPNLYGQKVHALPFSTFI